MVGRRGHAYRVEQFRELYGAGIFDAIVVAE